LTLLAVHLPRERIQIRIAVLNGSSPWAEALRKSGIQVDELHWHRALDARPFLTLRKIAAEYRPDVIHAWGARGVLAALSAGIASPRRLIASDVLPPLGEPGWIARQALRQIGRVIAFGRADAERHRRLGASKGQLIEARLATDPNWPPPEPESTFSPLPEDGRVLLGVGPLDAHKGFRDAVWMFDILHILYDDLRLVLVGPGSDRARVKDFSHVTGTHRHVLVTGPVSDLSPLRRRAVLAWVPGRTGGVQAALEAMSAGLPIIAPKSPALAEVVEHGVTGLLAIPGEKADFARQTRYLLDDEARRRAFGEAARRYADEHFAPRPLADMCARVYGG
jgi:glycosyltransferase involved in cell wall biosynthesis